MSNRTKRGRPQSIPMTSNPKPTTGSPEPTREQLEEDMAIDADFDTVLDRIVAGHGTDDGHHSV